MCWQSSPYDEGAQMVLLIGNLTLGTQAFATVENWNRLTVWGGALDAEPSSTVLQGTPMPLCAQFTLHTDVIVTMR